MSESRQQRGPDRDVDSTDPDVLLDIPKLSVDSIRLAVDGLDADLSLRARVANLLQVDAGVRVHLSGCELDVNGVHAEAQLRVRLEQLTRILGRALDTLDNDPQIIEALARTAGTAIDDVNRSTQQLAAGAAEVRASAVHSDDVPKEPGRGVGAAADRARPTPARPGLDRPGPGRPGQGRRLTPVGSLTPVEGLPPENLGPTPGDLGRWRAVLVRQRGASGGPASGGPAGRWGGGSSAGGRTSGGSPPGRRATRAAASPRRKAGRGFW
ncbi:hypothetical protein [Micromonospora tarensis]|uniref:Uncharacterized protein n=1 Tax=Micromonospora tarensis TaxID=2806100 RepID=A0ABS1Y9P0_9ACTN|nr:hypothetical protein [Micromonospora tarensis]MBM0274097.1 hypothetical protein [Micromonospora tarensis]